VLEDVEELGHVEEVQHPPPAPLTHPTVLVQRLPLSRSHRLRINTNFLLIKKNRTYYYRDKKMANFDI
jgi:hypothetical protein